MPYDRLPSITGRECLRAFQRLGFRELRQSGSHVVIRRDVPFAQAAVPLHRDLDRRTLAAILTGAGAEEFLAALRG